MKISLIFISLVFFISGCGDNKSAGERMGEAVSIIRGDKQPTKLLIPKQSKKTDRNSTKSLKNTIKEDLENSDKEIDTATKHNSGISLKEIALKAKEEIKKVTQPAQKLKEDVKGALQIAKESIKEVINENKESIKGTIVNVKSATKDKLNKAKESIKEEAKKIQEFITVDQTPSKKE